MRYQVTQTKNANGRIVRKIVRHELMRRKAFSNFGRVVADPNTDAEVVAHPCDLAFGFRGDTRVVSTKVVAVAG